MKTNINQNKFKILHYVKNKVIILKKQKENLKKKNMILKNINDWDGSIKEFLQDQINNLNNDLYTIQEIE